MRKAKLIYNPNSGEKSIVNSLDFIISIYQKNNITLIPYRIDKNECIDKAFLDIDDTYEHLIIAGGDGTIDIIINAMKNLNINLPVGILPVGTANDFAHSLGLEFDIKKATQKAFIIFKMVEFEFNFLTKGISNARRFAFNFIVTPNRAVCDILSFGDSPTAKASKSPSKDDFRAYKRRQNHHTRRLNLRGRKTRT